MCARVCAYVCMHIFSEVDLFILGSETDLKLKKSVFVDEDRIMRFYFAFY